MTPENEECKQIIQAIIEKKIGKNNAFTLDAVISLCLDIQESARNRTLDETYKTVYELCKDGMRHKWVDTNISEDESDLVCEKCGTELNEKLAALRKREGKKE